MASYPCPVCGDSCDPVNAPGPHPSCNPTDPDWEGWAPVERRCTGDRGLCGRCRGVRCKAVVDDPDTGSTSSGMRAVMPMVCRGCDRDITVGDRIALQGLAGGGRAWVCTACVTAPEQHDDETNTAVATRDEAA